MSPRVNEASIPDHGTSSSAAKEEFLALYEEHARPLLAWLSSRVARSDLEDVHQEIWEKVWAKKHQSFRGGNFRAWLFTVARNHIYDRHEKKPAAPLFADPEEAHVDPGQRSPLRLAIDREEHDVLSRCLARLPNMQRRIIELRLAGADYKAIARELGIATKQAHSLLFAAKRHLRTMLEER